MSNLGDRGPPERILSPPDLDLSYDEISRGEPVGRGGSGVVHRVEVSREGRHETIAVKQPDSDATLHRETADRFIEEARVWESLTEGDSNPENQQDGLTAQDHIVGIVDWGDGPVPWIAMEYMDGGNLREVLSGGTLPLGQAFWLGHCICRAVRHAHRYGVVHHDIKPENVLFREPTEGWLVPKVSDWGLARVMLDDDESAHGLTPTYAAPEQFAPGEFGSEDWATDIYQIGALTYELTTGRPPFEGTATEVREAKLSRVPTPPSEVADVPGDVDDAIMPALRRSKHERYDSIDYLRDELRGLFERHHDEGRRHARRGRSHRSVNATNAVAASTESDVDSSTDAPSASDNPAQTVPESHQSEAETDPTSWNQYRRELERRQSGFLFTTLPGGLRKLLYRDLVTEVEQAESRRERTQSDVESVKERARDLRDTLEDELHEARRRGKPLPESVVESVGELEDTLARIDSLHRDQTEYLRSDEQSTLGSLRDELAELQAYVDAKRDLDKEVDEIASTLDEIEAEIDDALDVDRLLTRDEERNLLDKLGDASRWIRTARRELTTGPLTDQDIERFDDLIAREKSIRRRVTTHNETLVQEEYDSQVEQAASARDSVESELATPKETGEPLSRSPKAYLEEIEPHLSVVESLRTSRKKEYLSGEQIEEVESIREELSALEAYVSDRRALADAVDEITSALDEREADIDDTLDVERLITENEERRLLEELGGVSEQIDDAKRELRDGPLTENDLERFDELVEREKALRRRVTEHNEEYSQTVYDGRIDAAAAVLDRVESEIDGPRSSGDSLPRAPEAFFEEIDPQLDAVDTLLASRIREFLSDEQIAELRKHRGGLAQERAFVRAKAQFEERMDSIRAAADELAAAEEEHLDWERYLTATGRQELIEKIERLLERLATLPTVARIELLAASDRERFDDYVDQAERVRRDVERYNDQFLSQERDRYTETFDELLGDGQSLNEKQELAIYRDEVHNRVIAGAGTGKTFSLAFRIKYLLDKGVQPDDVLALTFNKQAKKEMETRLEELFGIENVDCRTIHSFGLEALRWVDHDLIVVEEESRLREVERLVKKHFEDDHRFKLYYEKFMERYESENLSSDRQTRKEFYKSRQFQPGTTLRGEQIESHFEEVQEVHTSIADFLFEHEIDYRYRQYADWAGNPGGDAYIPDFTLPEHDVYIDYLPSEEVQRRQKPYERKRSGSVLNGIFEDTDKRLITISGDAISAGTVTKILQYHLDDNDVEYGSPLGERALQDAVFEHAVLERDVTERFAEFVKKARTNQIDVDARLESLDAEEDPMLFHFSHAAARLVDPYVRRYREYNASDYVDMILRSTDVIQDGRADEAVDYGHVLVDEFQDLNFTQIQFVQAILSRAGRAHLFAVGDDWQSIYGFKGARPDYFVDFHEYFEPAVDTRLETNYRCPPAVVEAGNDLIENNDVRTEKTVRAHKSTDTTPRVHLVPGRDDFQYVTNAITKIGTLVKESIDEGRSAGDIMILARNEEGSPFIRRISKHLSSNDVPVGGRTGVSVMTAHEAKGREAEHVIVANAVSDAKDGFPSHSDDRSLTEIVETADEETLDEERRLFYMALTRTKDRLDIQTRVGQQSPFLDEIRDHVSEQPVLVDCEMDRTTLTARAESTREREIWTTRQLGTLESPKGYKLSFAVPESATDAPLLEERKRYQFEGLKIGEYEGNPQFKIDDETTVSTLR